MLVIINYNLLKARIALFGGGSFVKGLKRIRREGEIAPCRMMQVLKGQDSFYRNEVDILADLLCLKSEDDPEDLIYADYKALFGNCIIIKGISEEDIEDLDNWGEEYEI